MTIKKLNIILYLICLPVLGSNEQITPNKTYTSLQIYKLTSELTSEQTSRIIAASGHKHAPNFIKEIGRYLESKTSIFIEQSSLDKKIEKLEERIGKDTKDKISKLNTMLKNAVDYSIFFASDISTLDLTCRSSFNPSESICELDEKELDEFF